MAFGADLGGSSEYSSGNFEDWWGDGFHVNLNCTWVKRSSGPRLSCRQSKSGQSKGYGVHILR